MRHGSGQLITLLELNPLPDTIAQLKSVCNHLKDTLFIIDNIDYIIGKEDSKSDFESTEGVLTDDSICKNVKVLCATSQSFSVLRELGIEYRLSSLSNENSIKLLLKLCTKLSSKDAKELTTVSMGIPLAIHLIHDLYTSGHKPGIILSGIEEDICNIGAVVGLEEKKQLIAITLQYIRRQEPKVQDALKTLSNVFSGTFDEFAARALITGTKFTKHDLLSRLNGSSLLNFDHVQNRFSIHPFYRRLVNEKEMISSEIKHK